MKKISLNTLELLTSCTLFVYITVSYVFKVQYHPLTLVQHGLLNVLLNSLNLFAIFFAIGCTISYIRQNNFVTISEHLVSIWILPVFAVTCACFYFSIFRFFTQPYFTNTLLVIIGVIFGISFQSELVDESSEKKINSKYNHSLSDNFYYLIVLILLVFPIEYFIIKILIHSIIAMFVLYVFLLVIWYIVSSKLSKYNFLKIEISKDNNVQTTIVVILFCIVSFFGLIVWDLTAISKSMIQDTLLQKIMYLILFGLIPIRLIPIIFAKTSLTIRFANILSLSYYILIKLYYYNWN